MNRQQWALRFKLQWTALCDDHGSIVLDPQLLQAARDQRQRGADPEPTAAGLYWGTKHAQADMRARGQL